MTLKGNILDWLKSTETLEEIGFTKKEIIKSLKDCKISKDDLYSFEHYQNEPKHLKIYQEHGKPFHEEFKTLVNVGSCGSGCRTEQYKIESVLVQSYYVPSNLQESIYESKIIRKLLENRFKWFKSFKWEIFGIEKDMEIYLKLTHGTIYVPVKALMKSEPKLIKDHMFSYWDQFRNQRDPDMKKCNHLPHQQFNGGCGKCQWKFFESEYIKPMKSRILKRLVNNILQS